MVRSISLDVVRIIAIALLLTSHIAGIIHNPIGGTFGIKGFYYVTLGGLAVSIFLILSGITLGLQYSNMNISYYNFILKRFYRIYPIYYMSIILSIFILIIKNYYFTGILSIPFQSFNISNIVLSITGFYAFAGKWGGPFVGTSWFIGVIISMYLLYPVISILIKKWPHYSEPLP